MKELIIMIFFISILLYFYWNYTIETSHYIINTSKNISKNFKIIQITDLHGYKKFYKNLIKIVYKEKPDVVVITGDLINEKTNELGIDFVKSISNLPIYFVSGNHESRLNSEVQENFLNNLNYLGVYNLDQLKIHDFVDGVNMVGISGECLIRKEIPEYINDLPNEKYNILLMHQPEMVMKLYPLSNVDLVFAGHAHGGQWIIPFVNRGVFAPNQGLFAKYVNGLYKICNIQLLVSRGIGTMTFVPRIYNRPHVVVVNVNKVK